MDELETAQIQYPISYYLLYKKIKKKEGKDLTSMKLSNDVSAACT